MDRERVISRWLILSGFMAAVGSSYGQQVSTFDAPQSIRTLISGINQQGSFVGNYTDTNNRVHGFLMSNGSFTTIDVPGLGPPNFAYSFAISINSKGDMVVLYYNPAYGPDGLSQYYVLSNGTYTPIQIPGANHQAGSIAVGGINNNGDIVGTYVDASWKQHGFLLSGGVVTTIDVPWSAGFTFADGINNRGDIVGWYGSSASPYEAEGFLLSNGVFSNIENKPYGTAFTSINDSGQIVGGCNQYSVGSSCTYVNGSFSTIPVPGSQWSGAKGINDRGMIVGFYNDNNGVQHGYIVTPSGSSQ